MKFEVKFHTHPYTQIELERSHVVRLEGPGIDATQTPGGKENPSQNIFPTTCSLNQNQGNERNREVNGMNRRCTMKVHTSIFKISHD